MPANLLSRRHGFGSWHTNRVTSSLRQSDFNSSNHCFWGLFLLVLPSPVCYRTLTFEFWECSLECMFCLSRSEQLEFRMLQCFWHCKQLCPIQTLCSKVFWNNDGLLESVSHFCSRDFGWQLRDIPLVDLSKRSNGFDFQCHHSTLSKAEKFIENFSLQWKVISEILVAESIHIRSLLLPDVIGENKNQSTSRTNKQNLVSVIQLFYAVSFKHSVWTKQSAVLKCLDKWIEISLQSELWFARINWKRSPNP